MQLSWSHKLFLVFNRWIGVSRWYDILVRFWARVALFILAGVVTVCAVTLPIPLVIRLEGLFWLLMAWCMGMCVGWVVAWVWPHPRPIVELSGVRTLVAPLSNWKSFPSDHAFSAWLLVFFAGLVWGNNWVTWTGVILASGVSVGRVLAGVHYPRDILAGLVLAGVVAWAFFG